MSVPADAEPILQGNFIASPAAPLAAGTIFTVTYTSTVDGGPLRYHEYLPAGYNSALAYPAVILLPSFGGNINQYDFHPEWTNEADARGYILATIEPRTLPGYPNSRGTFYMDGSLVPGEQDVFDGIAVLQTRHLINSTRMYLGGYSMGGVGSLNVAARNPGIFAATAPGAPISDFFQENAYTPTAATPNFLTIFGGAPGATVFTDSLWYEGSARFILPNLMHTPVWIMHGISDTLLPNDLSVYPYMQSRHIVDTPGYSDSRGAAVTLDQLAVLYPGSYIEQHSWPQLNHGTAGVVGVYSPTLIFDFFDAHTLDTNPSTIAYSTYDNKHTRAYWLQMNLVQPYSAKPGLVYADRDAPHNTVTLQVTGSLTLTLDLNAMGMASALPLTTVVKPIGYSSAGDLAIIYSGNWQTVFPYLVKKDSAVLPSNSYSVQPTRFTLLRQTSDVTHTYIISPSVPNNFFLPLLLR